MIAVIMTQINTPTFWQIIKWGNERLQIVKIHLVTQFIIVKYKRHKKEEDDLVKTN